MPTFDHDGVTIAYTDTGAPLGDPAAPTVVFGHGLLFSGWMFHRQVAALRDRFRCVTVDWRGQGATRGTGGGYDMDTLTGDALALLDHLGCDEVHWVGLSMGGFVGMRLAARHPARIASLTLLNTSAERETLRWQIVDTGLAVICRVAGLRPVYRSIDQTMFGKGFRASPRGRDLIGRWRPLLAGVDRRGMAGAVLGVVTRRSVLGELPAITAPTLVVSGARDRPTPPRRGRAIAGAIDGARYRELPGCGHSSVLERPDEVTTLIAEQVASAG